MNFSKKVFSLSILLIVLGLIVLLSGKYPTDSYAYSHSQGWQVLSVDTMKMSRDMAHIRPDDTNYKAELQRIKNMGANYVAIDTPYDPEFLPHLKTWTDEAHRLGLKVWFRGNWSAWEGWFGKKRNLSTSGHIQQTVNFIKKNPGLFQDGDSFTACPECEYGGPGSPLRTGKIKEFRNFTISEHQAVKNAFASIKKNVITNWISMNPDVAKVVVDERFLQETGGLITLDYYVRDPRQLEEGLSYFLDKYPGSTILLGEMGAPVPDINGHMTEEQQAAFLNDLLNLLEQEKFSGRIIGINYWVASYGTTGIFNDDGSERKAKRIISDHFHNHSRRK